MPSRKAGADKKLNSANVVESLKMLDSEQQLLAGLYFYESLTVEEISLILQKNKQDIRLSLETIFSKVFIPHSAKERVKAVVSGALR